MARSPKKVPAVGHITLPGILIAILLCTPHALFAETPAIIDTGVSWKTLHLSEDQIAHAQGYGQTLMTRSEMALLFEAEKMIQLGVLLEPALLIAHTEVATDFPKHHPPTKTMLRLNPQQAVDVVFRTLQEEVCEVHPEMLQLNQDDALAQWLPIGISAVPSAVTTSTSLRFANDLAIPVIALFYKAGPDACHLSSPYDGVF